MIDICDPYSQDAMIPSHETTCNFGPLPAGQPTETVTLYRLLDNHDPGLVQRAAKALDSHHVTDFLEVANSVSILLCLSRVCTCEWNFITHARVHHRV